MTQITVTGMGRAGTDPDYATFNFTALGQAQTSAAAIEQAASHTNALMTVLDEAGVAETDRGAQHTNVNRRSRWDGDREVPEGWEARITISCRTFEPSQAFALLEAAASVPQLSIHGPEWQVDEENPAHDEARALAIANAARKAKSYAEASGLQLGTLVELIEGASAEPIPAMRVMRMSAEVDALQPAAQEVTAAITLVYRTKKGVGQDLKPLPRIQLR
ncbi:MAG: SIMPL domain-containing protein [Acidimicrobiales bacterium]|nr:SIMPL domain-containing protein [Acidimicrobiales bacterium]